MNRQLSDQAELPNPIETSMDAALELEELKQGLRPDAPSLSLFFDQIRRPSPAFAGNGVRMLSDVKNYYKVAALQRKISSNENLATLVERFLADLERGVADRDEEKITEAKRLCIAVNGSLLGRRMDDMISRKENSDSRYIQNESST